MVRQPERLAVAAGKIALAIRSRLLKTLFKTCRN